MISGPQGMISLATTRKSGFDVEVWPIKNRKAATLMGCFLEGSELGSEIITDEWSGYLPLVRIGYAHGTVNHSL